LYLLAVQGGGKGSEKGMEELGRNEKRTEGRQGSEGNKGREPKTSIGKEGQERKKRRKGEKERRDEGPLTQDPSP
jgi:hypothetical protein